MIIYHVTHRSHVPPILVGVLRSGSWVCDQRRLRWAIRHVCEYHNWRVWDMAILVYSIPGHWLNRAGGRISGRWRTKRGVNTSLHLRCLITPLRSPYGRDAKRVG